MHPLNYKTGFGLYKATLRAIDKFGPESKLGWWFNSALYNAEYVLKDRWLVEKLLELRDFKITYNDLIPIN